MPGATLRAPGVELGVEWLVKLRYGDPEEVGMSGARVRRLAALAKSWVEQGMTPALVVLVARRGVIVLHEGFGTLTPEPDPPPLPRDAIYPISSIGKLFTATAAMILVDDGLLGLNRPVQEYVPEFVGEGKESVMVHHLLTHTTGLRDDEVNAHIRRKLASGQITSPPDVDDRRFDESPLLQYFSQAHDAPLGDRPSAEMSYCNYGYLLLGEIIRRVSDRPLATFVQHSILTPLEMGDTAYGVADSARGRFVRRPPDSPAGGLDDPDLIQRVDATGGVCTTAYDLATFGQMILNRGRYGRSRILSRASVAEMVRNQTPGVPASYKGEIFPESSWGLGFNVQGLKRGLRSATLVSPNATSHGGAGGTFFWIDSDSGMVGTYLSVNRVGPSDNAETPRWRADLFVNAAAAAIDEP